MSLRQSQKMTDQLMYETWAELLRPQFAEHAQFSFKPRRRTIVVKWAPEGSNAGTSRTLSIVFTNLAWKGYRGARSARRARADANLVALVNAHLAHLEADGGSGYDFSSADAELEVASVDLFPPPSSSSRPAAETLARR
jgi:hypothetical protein